MKFRFLLVILIILFGHSAHATKGRSGSYTFKFIMFDRETELPVPHADFIINNDTLKTDSNGSLMYVFKWQTICPSVVPPPLRRVKVGKVNRHWNKYITLEYSGHDVKKIRSCWKHYGLQDKRNANSALVEVYIKW